MANTKISALPTFTGDSTGVFLVIDNAGLTQTYKISIDSLLATLSGITTPNDVRGRYLISTNASADEGGEINLTKPPNATISGGVTIDAYVDKVRIFEQGGSARGVFVDLTKAPGGVAGELFWKSSGLVNAGTFVQLDNIKATVTTSGNRGLSIAAVSSSFTAAYAATYDVSRNPNTEFLFAEPPIIEMGDERPVSIHTGISNISTENYYITSDSNEFVP